jgi:hypothetical protein
MKNTETPLGTFAKAAAFAADKNNLQRNDAEACGLQDIHTEIEFVIDGLYARRAEFA